MEKNGLITIKLQKKNVFLNIIKNSGETIQKFSAGTEKYSGASKKTAIAKFDIAMNVGLKLKSMGYTALGLRFTGGTKHRRSVIKGFKNAGLNFSGQLVSTRLHAHNGCKKKRSRRV